MMGLTEVNCFNQAIYTRNRNGSTDVNHAITATISG